MLFNIYKGLPLLKPYFQKYHLIDNIAEFLGVEVTINVGDIVSLTDQLQRRRRRSNKIKIEINIFVSVFSE